MNMATNNTRNHKIVRGAYTVESIRNSRVRVWHNGKAVATFARRIVPFVRYRRLNRDNIAYGPILKSTRAMLASLECN